MSRTIKEIYNEAVAERNRRLELAEFASDSKLSVMNGILWVVAEAIYSFETLLDVFAVDISEAINGRITVRLPIMPMPCCSTSRGTN